MIGRRSAAAWRKRDPEALDTDGDGKVSIYAIAHEIAEHSGLAPAEAAELSRVLGEAEDARPPARASSVRCCVTTRIGSGAAPGPPWSGL